MGHTKVSPQVHLGVQSMSAPHHILNPRTFCYKVTHWRFAQLVFITEVLRLQIGQNATIRDFFAKIREFYFFCGFRVLAVPSTNVGIKRTVVHFGPPLCAQQRGMLRLFWTHMHTWHDCGRNGSSLKINGSLSISYVKSAENLKSRISRRNLANICQSLF